MKKRSSFAAVTLFILALVVPGFIFAQQRQTQSKPVPGTSPARRGRPQPNPTLPVTDAFSEALKLVQDNHVDGAKVDYNSLFKSSIQGMLRTLDPHSNYFDKEEFDDMKTDQRSEYFGIGASIQNYAVGDEVETFITATFENAPAARAGLRFGDRIAEVDGVTMTGKSAAEVRDKIRGPRGSSVKVTVERAADKSTATLLITRDVVPQPSVPDYYLIGPGVGYVDMTRGFNFSTAEELRNALAELHGKGMKSLVLDLRGNPGGFLDQAIEAAELFLPKGELILTQKGRNGMRDEVYHSRNPNPDLTPMVILVDENTASASEIVSGAMQDHDRALIVGNNSFGKGLVQSIIPLEYGSGLVLTTAKYYTPSGRLIQRDYSNGDIYDYYTRGGSTRLDGTSGPATPTGPAMHTDTGRAVYGGGGIAPDENIDARTASLFQRRLLSPLFLFARELANGRVAGFEKYSVQKPIDFSRELQSTDFPMTDALFKTFKDYVASAPTTKPMATLLDHNRSFIAMQLRFDLAMAAYGRVMAERVLITTDDPQVAKAVNVLPRARDLAMSATRVHAQQP